MHFEVPKAKSIREFGGEYLMIVISILTALALEAVVEKVHHDHVAHEASVQIDAELRANIDDVEKVLAHNEERKKAMIEVRRQMLAAIKAKVTDAAFLQRLQHEWQAGIRMSLQMPSLRREAWEAAVASQAASWMPHAQLEKYANAYAEIRDVGALLNGGAVPFLDGPRMQDVFSNVEMGIGDPKDIVRTVTQMVQAYGSTDGNLDNLVRELRASTSKAGQDRHG